MTISRSCRLAVVAAGLLAAACTPSPETVIERAKAYHAKGDDISAAIELKDILASNPKNQELYFLLGVVLADLGEPVNAENSLRRARLLGKAPVDVTPVLVRVLLELEKFPEALKELASDRVLSRSTSADVALLRGRAHAGVGQLAEASTQFVLAMKDRPAPAKLGLARIAMARNDRGGAEKLIEEVLAKDPDSADPLMLKAEIFGSENKFDEAAAAYQQVIKAKPRNTRALLNLATLMLNRGQIEAAKPILERGEKLEPSSPLLRFVKALHAYKEKRYDDANDELKALFEMMPRHYPGLMLAGMVSYETAQYALAQNSFALYLQRYPDDLVALRMLGASLLAKGQPHLAVNVLERGVENIRDAGYLAIAADANRQVGRFAAAKALLEKAIELEPKNSELLTSLGLTELALGSRQRAISNLEAAIALKPASARADEAVIMMLLGDRQLERAQRAANALEQRLPDAPETHTLKGAILLVKQEPAKARENFERALRLRPTHAPAAEALADLDAREGRPEARRARIDAILKVDAINLWALLELAKLDLAEGRQAQGVAAIRRAIAEHPESINGLLMLAEVQLRGGEAAEAVISARQARDLQPYDTRATILLGDAQLEAGDRQGAITTFTGLVAAQPKLVSAHMRLAAAFLANGHVDKANATVLEALKVTPTNLAARALLGDIMIRTNRLADALALAAEVQLNRPKAPLGYRMEGDALMLRKDFSRAAVAFQKAAGLEASAALLIKVHQAQSAAQGTYASDVALRKWIAGYADETEVRLYLTDALSSAGRYREAIAVCMEVLQLIPQSPQALNNLAWALHASGDPKALDYAKQAVKLNPKSAATVDTLGWILVSQGNAIEGVQALLDAVVLDDADPSIRFHLAQALIKVGDVSRAKSELAIALKATRSFPELKEAKALLAQLGR